jgi:hypothetical protein
MDSQHYTTWKWISKFRLKNPRKNASFMKEMVKNSKVSACYTRTEKSSNGRRPFYNGTDITYRIENVLSRGKKFQELFL